MRKHSLRFLSIFIVISFSLSLSACRPEWEINLTSNDQTIGLISASDIHFYIENTKEETEIIPLGQLLYMNELLLIDEISLCSEAMECKTFLWDDIATTANISESGKIEINGNFYSPIEILVRESSLTKEIGISIIDIAPTMAHALDLPELPKATGDIKYEAEAEHGVMILLDGLQYEKLAKLIKGNKLPFLDSIGKIKPGLTAYPPVTTTATASVLTGTMPRNNGVYSYGYRSTETTTLFDLAKYNDMSVTAVEGASLAFNLRNAETILSGDRDGNGFSDDNVCLNSLDVIQSNMPDLLYIHFHNIDDMGHEFGPESPEYESAIIRVDSYLESIINALPENTFIIIFADHGMHTTEDGGNHGTLTSEDLIIPIIFIEK